MIITVYNKSTVVTNNELTIIVDACNILIKSFCLYWKLLPINIVLVTIAPPQFTNYLFTIIDFEPIKKGTISYYTQIHDKVIGFVLAKVILDNGGAIYYENSTTHTIGSALFHIILESIINPSNNKWWQQNTTLLIASDVCNPVDNNVVPITVTINHTSTIVGLADFITPAWYNPEAASTERFDYADSVYAPFVLGINGFVREWNFANGPCNMECISMVTSAVTEVTEAATEAATEAVADNDIPIKQN